MSHCVSRSAPASPTHHPFITDIKDSDGGYLIHTQSNTSSLHPFTLPYQLPQFVNTSHSLPPSPSRLPSNPPGYPPGQGLRFFTPLRVQSTSADALALESRRRVEEGCVEIPSKKPRLSNELDPSQHPKNIIIRSPQPAMMAPQQAMPCYPMPQAAPIRYHPPFVGMPMFVPQGFSAIPLQETKGDKERETVE